MNVRPSFHRLVGAAVLAGWFGAAGAVTLYDPGLGTVPAAQGWTTNGTPGYTQNVSGGVYRLDTTLANAVMAGSALTGLSLLDTAGAGFELDFGLRIVSESHARPERAGFSMIVTGLDPSHALELAFWGDRVYAYTPGFDHGAEALWATTGTTSYALVVAANQYKLFGNGTQLLAGSLVDYGAFGVPYTVPGFLFFGDDTSSAQSSVELGRVALVGAVVGAVPEPSTAALMVASLCAGVAVARRRRGKAAASPFAASEIRRVASRR